MKNAFTLLQAVVIVAGLAILAAVLLPVYTRYKVYDVYRPYCPNYLKQIGLGIRQYVQDYDGSYPRASSKQGGWMDVLQPYLGTTKLFQCPAETSGATQGTTDYFYNSRLSGVKEARLSNVSSTIMNGEGLGDSPSNYSLSELPAEWINDSNSPSWRHPAGGGYSYTDGHVKRLQPTSVRTTSPAPNTSTFAVK